MALHLKLKFTTLLRILSAPVLIFLNLGADMSIRASALSAVLLVSFCSTGVHAQDAGVVISSPGVHDGLDRSVGYLYVRTSNAVVKNYRVTGSGSAISCVSFSGDNITIQHIRVQNCGGAGVVFESGTNNVLEDSFIADPITRPGQDSWAIYQSEKAGHITVRRVKAYGSGFGVFSPNGSSLIEDNEFSIPDSYRTDCHGKRQTGGACNCGEFGIATKTGRNVIRSNRISGYRQSDPICGGSGSPGSGISLAACAANTQLCPSRDDVVEYNVITDSHFGIYLPPQASHYRINANLICRSDIAISDGYSRADSSIVNNEFSGNDIDLQQYNNALAVTSGNHQVTAANCPR